jgi:hypothetical protein
MLPTDDLSVYRYTLVDDLSFWGLLTRTASTIAAHTLYQIMHRRCLNPHNRPQTRS